MLRALVVIVVFVAVGLPNVALPFVLSGVLDALLPFGTLLCLLGLVVICLTFGIVVYEVSQHLARSGISTRQAVSAATGGALLFPFCRYPIVAVIRTCSTILD